jgi:hypothetical protein
MKMDDMVTLLSELSEIESEMKDLESRKLAVRTSIQELVTAAGGKIVVDGIATAQMTQPSQRVSYDTEALDKLMAEAVAAGDMQTAHALGKARSTKTVAGILQIRKAK